MLRLPKVLLICFVIFTFSSGLGFLDTTLSLFAINTFRLSPSEVGLIFLGFSLAYCLSSPVLDFTATDFTATDFTATDFTVTDFTVTDFTATDFTATDFTVTDFTATDFTVTDFTATDFTVTDFTVTDFTATDFTVTDFTATDFTATDFTATDFTVTDFTATDFTAADFTVTDSCSSFQAVRRYFMVVGGLLMALGFCFMGPAPLFRIPSQLWLTILMLCVNGFGTGMGITPILPEIIAMLYGPLMGGFLTQQLTFEWAATLQGALSALA
ncbi:hypothetical protein CRUP_007436, partial [Coryphaenoides rupestris]